MKYFTTAVFLLATIAPSSLLARPMLNPSDPEAVTKAVPQVMILGAVQEPGARPMLQPVTVTEALALAGGRTVAAGFLAIVIHGADNPAQASPRPSTKVDLERLEAGDLAQNVTLAAGDTVYVPNASVFYIRGQVRNPGAYVLRSGATVSQAIAVAGGLTAFGSDRTDVTRTIDGKSTTSSVKGTDAIEPDDTIVVGRRRF